MTAAYAAEIVTWSYPPPYDCYDMTAVDPVALTDPVTGMFALTDSAELIGFRSFGADGQVPGGDYDGSALDTGGGLRPDLVGKGLGRRAVTTGLSSGFLRPRSGSRSRASTCAPDESSRALALSRPGASRGPDGIT